MTKNNYLEKIKNLLFSIIRFFLILDLKLIFFFYHTRIGYILFIFVYLEGFFSKNSNLFTQICHFFASYLIATVVLFFVFLNLEFFQKIAFKFVSREEITSYIGNMFAKGAFVRTATLIGASVGIQALTAGVDLAVMNKQASLPVEVSKEIFEAAKDHGVELSNEAKTDILKAAQKTSNEVILEHKAQGLVTKVVDTANESAHLLFGTGNE